MSLCSENMPVQREAVWTCLDLSQSLRLLRQCFPWSGCGPVCRSSALAHIGGSVVAAAPALCCLPFRLWPRFKGCCCPLRLGGRSCESSAYLSETQLGELKIHRNLIFKYLDFPHIRALEYSNAGLTGHLSTVPFNTYSSQVFFLPMDIVSIRHFNEDSTSKFSQFLLIFLLFLNLCFSEGIAWGLDRLCNVYSVSEEDITSLCIIPHRAVDFENNI